MLNSLSDISKARFHNTSIRIRAIVSGKSSSPYKIPLTIEVKCLGCGNDACKYRKKKELTIKAKDELFLLFIDVPTTRLGSIVKTVFMIPCKKLAVTVLETQNVLRIFVSQPPGEDRTKWMSAQTSYFVGHDIDANHTFYLEGYSTVDPKSQLATYIFLSAEKAKSDIESFELSTKVNDQLKEFQQDVTEVSDVFQYLDKLYESYALNVTKIYGRFLLHLAIDLVFHSALEFTLPGGRLQPARLDVIILGDTRCGKGHVAEGLLQYYGIGEMVGAENCFNGDVKVLTKEFGSVPIKDIVGKVTLLNRYGNWIQSTIQQYGKQKTVEAVFRHGTSRRAIKVRVTLNHNWRI